MNDSDTLDKLSTIQKINRQFEEPTKDSIGFPPQFSLEPMKKIIGFYLLVVCIATALYGCGGSIDKNAGTSPASSTPSLAPLALDNSIPVVVDKGPLGNATNVPYVSVTICQPDSTNCETIDHVLLDSRSTGLRLFASALKDPSIYDTAKDPTGANVAECAGFGSGYTWGAIRKMDIKLGIERARNATVHIINDAAVPNVPASCSSQGVAVTRSVAQANGILGITGSADCADCASPATAPTGVYFSCAGTACSGITQPIAEQIHNPVSVFDTDNNGILISLPQAQEGAATLTGKLVFGIGTRSNNQLGSAIVHPLDENSSVLAVVNGQPVYMGFDTGSTGVFYNGGGNLAECDVPGLSDKYYCSASSATIQLVNASGNAKSGAPFTMNFQDPNQYKATYPNSAVNLFLSGPPGGTNTPDPGVTLLGLPFFMGRPVFFALDGAQTPAGTGPYIAF
ncbi:DUF3443 family protein [Paraburkholderia xenovorans]|uniref:DUF3443 family protein n=1 Tax=Paraburkholderia xenovorans TaxID=36873 RepID=UPI0038BC37D2